MERFIGLAIKNRIATGLMLASLVVFALVIQGTALAAQPNNRPPKKEPLQAVSQVNLDRYAGDWFEIALIPYFFQSQCAANAKVVYTALKPGTFRDYFECEQKNGKKSISVGRARVANSKTNATLSATFLNILGWRYWFGENYWITDLADDYSYSVVVHPSRNYAWILARTPNLPADVLAGIATRLSAQGVDPCRLKMSPQAQGSQKSISLCEAIKAL
ncbi:MAG: lipocalin family protein [Vampirovibrionales bacterium]|nr:lipocalin family protein [Vampirovibrionales bacterium]